MSIEVRRYLYPVALAVLALLGGYGLLSETEIALWAAFVVALLGLGTATSYRPTQPQQAPQPGQHRQEPPYTPGS